MGKRRGHFQVSFLSLMSPENLSLRRCAMYWWCGIWLCKSSGNSVSRDVLTIAGYGLDE